MLVYAQKIQNKVYAHDNTDDLFASSQELLSMTQEHAIPEIEIVLGINSQKQIDAASILDTFRQGQEILSHGALFTGKPSTKIFSNEHYVVKQHLQLQFSPLNARRWIQKKAEEERTLGIYPPGKTWFLTLGDKYPLISNIAPRLIPMHKLADQVSHDDFLSFLKRMLGMYFQTAATYEKNLDEGLSNFGVDQYQRLYYLDDDIYSWNEFASFCNAVGVYFRHLDWITNEQAYDLGLHTRGEILMYFEDAHWVVVIIEQLRHVFAATPQQSERIQAFIFGLYAKPQPSKQGTYTYEQTPTRKPALATPPTTSSAQVDAETSPSARSRSTTATQDKRPPENTQTRFSSNEQTEVETITTKASTATPEQAENVISSPAEMKQPQIAPAEKTQPAATPQAEHLETAEQAEIPKQGYNRHAILPEDKQSLRLTGSGPIAILGDIHANLPAFEVVLKQLKQMNIERGLVLGDIVGYGPHPTECIERLQANPWLTVLKGNHDHAAGLGKVRDGFSTFSRWVIEWTITQLNEAQKDWLNDLPVYYEENDCLAIHGAPRDKTFFNGYVYRMTYEENLNNLQERNLRHCFHGHTHIPGAYVRDAQGDSERFGESSIDLQNVTQSLICPGSIGQPRNGNPETQFALFHPDQQRVEFFTLPYNLGRTIADMERNQFPSSLIERLQQGK